LSKQPISEHKQNKINHQTSENTVQNPPPFTSMEREWRGSRPLSSWGYTFRRASAGQHTPLQQLRRPSSDYTSRGCFGETDWTRSCWCPSTGRPSRACCHTPSLCGMLAVQLRTRKPCREWLGWQRKPSAAPCPLWNTSPPPAASAEQIKY